MDIFTIYNLKTYEEANEIYSGTNDDAKDMLSGRRNTAQQHSGNYFLEYWLGSSSSYGALVVWYVSGIYTYLWTNGCSNSITTIGARPVLTVLTSDVTPAN